FHAGRFCTAPVLWRFPIWSAGAKAAEDCHNPRRWRASEPSRQFMVPMHGPKTVEALHDRPPRLKTSRAPVTKNQVAPAGRRHFIKELARARKSRFFQGRCRV